MDIETVCVIGGTGFVGRSVCDQACAAGYRVRVVTRSRPRAAPLTVLPTLEVVTGDVMSDAFLERALQGMDAVVNLAGVIAARGRSTFKAVHVELPRRIGLAARKAGVRRFLHMSALGASTTGPSEYQRSKGEGEDAVRTAASEYAWTVFRPSIIFGKDDRFLNMFAGLARVSPMIPLAKPDARFQPIWVEDVARCFVAALEDPRAFGQAYELCGPTEYTLEQLVRYSAGVAGTKARIMRLPDSLAQVQAFTFEHLPGKLITRDNLRSMSVDNTCKGPFPAVFGFAPTPMEAVVPEYLAPASGSSRFDRYRHNAGR